MRTRSKKKTAVIATCVVLVLLVATLLGRGLIRATLIPAYVNHFYKPAIGTRFDQDFSEVDQELAKYGLTFNDQDGYAYECYSGDKVFFERWRETVPCYRAQGSDQKPFTSEMVDNWKKNSLALEQFLLQHGWHKEWNEAQPIEEIFNHESGAGVVYSKAHGKTVCSLQIFSSSDPSQTHTSQSCDRDVKFFGGY